MTGTGGNAPEICHCEFPFFGNEAILRGEKIIPRRARRSTKRTLIKVGREKGEVGKLIKNKKICVLKILPRGVGLILLGLLLATGRDRNDRDGGQCP